MSEIVVNILSKFKLLNNENIKYTISIPLNQEVDGQGHVKYSRVTDDLKVKDVYSMALSQTPRIQNNIPEMLTHINIYKKLLEYNNKYELYISKQKEVVQEEGALDIVYLEPVFQLTNSEIEYMIKILDSLVVYPNDSNLDNLVRGYCILDLSFLMSKTIENQTTN